MQSPQFVAGKQFAGATVTRQNGGENKTVDSKTRKIFEILRQHVHETNWHQFDGEHNGAPVLGIADSKECQSEPCIEITRLTGAMTVA